MSSIDELSLTRRATVFRKDRPRVPARTKGGRVTRGKNQKSRLAVAHVTKAGRKQAAQAIFDIMESLGPEFIFQAVIFRSEEYVEEEKKSGDQFLHCIHHYQLLALELRQLLTRLKLAWSNHLDACRAGAEASSRSFEIWKRNQEATKKEDA